MVHKNICVVSITERKARKEIFSLISKAKELIKDSEEKLIVLIIGELSEEDKKNIYRCGGDNLLHCCCKDIDMAKYETITNEVYEKYKPSFLMFPAFSKEKSCAAKLTVQVKAGLIADCINVERNRKGEFVFTRTAMNDSVIAEIVCINTEVAMCTVKSGVFESNFSYGESGKYEEVEFGLPFYENNLQLMERSLLEVNSLKREVDFSNSKIVFGIGRGVRDKETYDLIEKLANKLHGEIAGTLRTCRRRKAWERTSAWAIGDQHKS